MDFVEAGRHVKVHKHFRKVIMTWVCQGRVSAPRMEKEEKEEVSMRRKQLPLQQFQ